MKNIKHTREYAEALAIKLFPIIEGTKYIKDDEKQQIERNGCINGYMKAIEETNVAELTQALVKINEKLNQLAPATAEMWLKQELSDLSDVAEKAIEKANKK